MLKGLKSYFNKDFRMGEEINDYLKKDYKIHPYSEALRIAFIYGISGSLWILFSDEILSRIVSSINDYKRFATYKGWAFVFVTMMLVFLLVLKRVTLFGKAIEKIYNNYEDLNLANEELIDLEEELREQFNELSFIAHYDMLTKLPNRLLFETKVNELIAEKNNSKTKFALVYMDIDNFKHINDTLGHSTGDLLLKYIANILKYQVKAPDLMAKLGGDEFALIFNNVNHEKDVVDRIQALMKFLRRTWRLNKQEFFVSYSIGIAMYPEHGNSLSLLLKNADIAMYLVKKSTKDNYSFYFAELEEKNSRKIKMINDLRLAIDNEDFVLYYQPIVNLNSAKLVGVEALIRWIHPIMGMVSPMEFIPLAEERGLIYDIDKWVLRTALMQKKKWEEQGYVHIKMSVNVSGKGVTSKGFINEFKDLISETKLKCEEIQLEVTETAVIEDIEASINILKEIKTLGVKIALDDFGKGYSSLTYLQKLPIDIVKIDREFIINILDMGQNDVLVENIIKLTHDLNLEIVAEGIETNEQLEFLKLCKSDYGQGYLFSKPVTSEELEKLLEFK